MEKMQIYDFFLNYSIINCQKNIGMRNASRYKYNRGKI